MSNRTLAYILIIIVVAAAAVFAVWRLNARKANQLSAGQKEGTNQVSAPAPENPSLEPNQPASGVLNGCERKFDAEKLKTAKVDIKNREVEINVKNFGKIVMALDSSAAPKTVENFLKLVNAGFYDCLTFHRIAKDFVIQGGDPEGTGQGGPGYTLPSEIKLNHKKGSIAMARLPDQVNPNKESSGSQFYIALNDLPMLDGQYTVFGQVAEGMDVVEKIGKTDINPGPFGPTDGAPKQPVVMESVKIVK